MNMVNNIYTFIEVCIYILVVYLFLLFMGIVAVGNIILYIIHKVGIYVYEFCRSAAIGPLQ
jgi:hypothetical protein